MQQVLHMSPRVLDTGGHRWVLGLILRMKMIHPSFTDITDHLVQRLWYQPYAWRECQISVHFGSNCSDVSRVRCQKLLGGTCQVFYVNQTSNWNLLFGCQRRMCITSRKKKKKPPLIVTVQYVSSNAVEWRKKKRLKTYKHMNTKSPFNRTFAWIMHYKANYLAITRRNEKKKREKKRNTNDPQNFTLSIQISLRPFFSCNTPPREWSAVM